MLIAALDAGASKAGMVVIRATKEVAGTRFSCLRHGHMELEGDGGAREEAAVTALLALADWTLQLRQGDERIVFAVEGIEGGVFAKSRASNLFDTADQAGGIRWCLRTWARWRGLRWIDPRDVRKTTASKCRKFVFGKGDRHGSSTSFGDDEVVLAVLGCVADMPPIPVPVPDPRNPAYAPMHSYDAALVALAVGADVLGWGSLRLPISTLTKIELHRVAAAQKKEAKKLLAAAGAKVPRAPRIESRGTKRRRREATIAAARRSA